MSAEAGDADTAEEWIVDATGCSAVTLGDGPRLRALFDAIVADLGLHVVGELWHTFAGAGGVTGMYLLSESHLTCHTYPELGVATFNLACCRPRPRWPWEARLATHLGAASVAVRRVLRAGGLGAASPGTAVVTVGAR
jgi:S-adenosylmethionine decarboxylase